MPMKKEKKQIKIFTDGACSGNPGPGGWSAIFCIDGKIKVLKGNDPHTTNNRMELQAVLSAIQKILHSKTKDIEYNIYSDSAYVVNAITFGWIHDWQNQGWTTRKGDQVKNMDLWQKCSNALQSCKMKHKNIKFIKVKGHAGNPLNEYADRVARMEASKIAKKMGN